MPKVKTSRQRPPPEGFELLEATLAALAQKMRDAETAPHEGKRACEASWAIARVNHERSRYVFDMHFRKRAVSRAVLDYCVRMGHADAALIALWRRPGYERVCCVQCAQRTAAGGTVCVCRVPRAELPPGKSVECVNCGCHGCASCDA